MSKRRDSSQESISKYMASSDGLGYLSILNDDLLRLILLDETLKGGLHCLASRSSQLLRHVLKSGVDLMLCLDDVKLVAKWGEWLQQASGLHLRLDTAYDETAEDAPARSRRPGQGQSSLSCPVQRLSWLVGHISHFESHSKGQGCCGSPRVPAGLQDRPHYRSDSQNTGAVGLYVTDVTCTTMYLPMLAPPSIIIHSTQAARRTVLINIS